jgi:hypothetical protein
VLSSLLVAEERITTRFSSLVGAHGSEEEAAFLATQQVDEARHMRSTPASKTRSSPPRQKSPPMSNDLAARFQTRSASCSTLPSSKHTSNSSRPPAT